VQSRQHVRDVLERERALADRTGMQFSVVVFRIQGQAAWSRTIHRLSHAMTKRIRSTDEVGWFDSRCLCAVLRATKGEGAIHFAEDVCGMLKGKVACPAFTVYTYPDPVPAEPVADERRAVPPSPAGAPFPAPRGESAPT